MKRAPKRINRMRPALLGANIESSSDLRVRRDSLVQALLAGRLDEKSADAARAAIAAVGARLRRARDAGRKASNKRRRR